jgi:hypothetical protein
MGLNEGEHVVAGVTEGPVPERLKVRSRCDCNLWARQMRCTEPSEMPIALAIARPVQWVAWCGGSVQVSATTRVVVFRRQQRLARLAGLVAQQTVNLALGKALLPSPHRWPADADAFPAFNAAIKRSSTASAAATAA